MSSATTCPTCRAPVTDDWRFCVECGTERPGLYDEPVVSPDGADAPVPADAPADERNELPGGAAVRWRFLDAMVVFFVALFATVVLSTLALVAIGEDPTPGQEDALLTISLIANQLTLAAGTIWWLKGRFGAGLGAIGLGRPTRAHVGIGMAAGGIGVVVSALVAATIVFIVEAIRNRPAADPEQIPLQTEDPTVLLLVFLALSTVVLAPIAEEIFFRGMLHQAIRRRLAFRSGIVFSSAIFAAVHLHPLVIPSIFALSLILSVVYERTKSLWPPIFAHATFNAVGFAASFLVG